MKNKNLLTSFMPMLATAALLIIAPMAREAFYSATSSGKSISFKLPEGFIVSTTTIAVQPKVTEGGTTLRYTGNQFPAHYKDGIFKVINNSIRFLPLNGNTPDKLEIFASDLPTAATTGSPQLPSLSQGPDGSVNVSCGSEGVVYHITYK